MYKKNNELHNKHFKKNVIYFLTLSWRMTKINNILKRKKGKKKASVQKQDLLLHLKIFETSNCKYFCFYTIFQPTFTIHLFFSPAIWHINIYEGFSYLFINFCFDHRHIFIYKTSFLFFFFKDLGVQASFLDLLHMWQNICMFIKTFHSLYIECQSLHRNWKAKSIGNF